MTTHFMIYLFKKLYVDIVLINVDSLAPFYLVTKHVRTLTSEELRKKSNDECYLFTLD